MSTYSAPKGVPPKPPSQRRRRNKPASYGAAEPVLTGQGQEQPPLGFDAHALVAGLWAALGSSVEGQFFSAADWQRARLEMWHADKLIRGGQPTANQWATMQRGLDELLSGWLVSGYWLGLTLGRVVLGRATRRFGNLLVIQVCLGGTAAGVLLLWLAPGTLGAAVGLLLAGFSLGPIFPTMIAVTSAVVPQRLLPSAIGFMASLGAGGAALFPWVAGNLADALGLWAILPYVICLIAVVLALWLLFQSRLPKVQEPQSEVVATTE